ncbi:MAG: FHA domain-containing protein [Planctomycetota bacterium]|jgi:pSer/pThr/pTyr-binding forkhead associated (FHA) protein
MEFHQRLDKFHQKYGGLDKESFEAIFPDPILAIGLSGIPVIPDDFDTYAESREAVDATLKVTARKTGISLILAVPLVKSDRNQDMDRITLGRAPENDLVVPHPTVSKSHVYFVKDPESGAYFIFEAGSSAGTHVNGKPLKKGPGVPVKTGTVFVFAKEIKAKVFSPAGFYTYMEKMIRKKKSAG